MQCSVNADVKSTKRGIFQQNTLKKNAVVIKSTLDSNCNSSRDTAIRENFNVKPETQMKKLIPITEATIPINTMK